MLQSFTALLALGLASGVRAMPSGNLNTTQISPDGSCGGTTGFVCATGFCCSTFGFCGAGTAFCGTRTGSGTGTGTGNGTGTTTGTGTGAITCTSKIFYSGDGSTGNGWPDESAWASFDNLWNANFNAINGACQNNGWGVANNSPTETSELRSAITSVAASAGVDERFVLATVMQESKGCVRVPTTHGFWANPGLMQDANGTNTCSTSPGAGINPCPNNKIVGMIQDGTIGTTSGPGLKQILANLTTTGAQAVYQAARRYNSGSIPVNGSLSEGGSTSSYSSDIANRLTGCVF